MGVQTPCYVVDEKRLRENLTILRQVAEEAGCKILLAQKAFSMFAVYPLIGEYLAGTTASGLFEAKLGREEMGGETYIFSAAYVEEEFEEILQVCDHISFNSFAQWKKYRERALKAGKSCSIRINPEHSTQEHGIYDPCAAGSRLGVTRKNFEPEELEGIEGLHFHTLCEQNSDALLETVQAVLDRVPVGVHPLRHQLHASVAFVIARQRVQDFPVFHHGKSAGKYPGAALGQHFLQRTEGLHLLPGIIIFAREQQGSRLFRPEGSRVGTADSRKALFHGTEAAGNGSKAARLHGSFRLFLQKPAGENFQGWLICRFH